MFRLEIKRLLKTRSNIALAALALAASAFFAVNFVLDDGKSVESRPYLPYMSGFEAIDYLKGISEDMGGYVTPERIEEMSRFCDEALSTYQSFDAMPEDVFDRYVANMEVLSRVSYGDSDYYQRRNESIEYTASQVPNEAVAEAAAELNSHVDEPFYWEYGFGSSDVGQTWNICLFVLCLIATVIAAPVFSQAYATGEDGILRCSKYGRGRLARTKILAVYSFCTALFLICAAVFSGILLLAFGPDRSSAQLKISQHVLINLNMNEALALFILSGLLTMLASISLTMWLSSMQANTVMVLVISAAALALPMFADHYLDYPVADWVRLLLPGGGTGLQNGMYYELSNLRFLAIGSFAIWTPFVMLAVPVVETPVFALLTRQTYIKHEA